MKIGGIGAAILTAIVIAGVAPAESGQRGPSDEIQRRREAMRERREELRRARQAARRGPTASEPFTAVAKIGRQGTFNLVSPAGTVTITASGGDDVRIDAVKRVWDRTDAEAKAALSDVTIDVTERQGGVDVRANAQRAHLLDAEVDFTIAVPTGASVSIRTGSGDVTVSGIRGELRAETAGGSIKATSLGQVRLLRTLSGAVSLDNAESSDVTVSTLSGAVTVRQLKAKSADLRTVAGDVAIADSDAERLIVQSLSGRVELTGRLAPTGRYSLQSQSGDIQLTPIGTSDFELEAATVGGTLRSDFPITVDDRREATGPGTGTGLGRIGRAGRSGGRGDGTGRGIGGGNVHVLRGVSGSGGPVVTARSFRGNITIIKR